MLNASLLASGLVVSLCALTAGCSDERPQASGEPAVPAVPGEPVQAQRAVLPESAPGATLETATFDEMVDELGIQIDEGVPAEDAESLQALMGRSGYRIKRIRLVEPGCYTINVWGQIPHGASELTLRRKADGWEIVGDTPWVLISDGG